ncbi:MAG: hypothetical protein ACRDE5_02395 [Ginsengibacter sp.]
MRMLSCLKSLSVIGIFITILFSCNENDKLSIEKSASVFDIKQAEASITQSNQNFMRSFKDLDSVGAASCYTTYAKAMAANMAAVKGRNNITHFINGLMKKGFRNLEISTTNIWGDSSIVAEEGVYSVTDSIGKNIDKGKYIVLWKPEAGNWKMFRDIWTTDLPDSSAIKKLKTVK